MKNKITLFLSVLITAVNLSAQNIVTTKDGQKIDNTAIVLLRSGESMTVELQEMTSRQVVYLENGERKTIPATEINTVTLANGQVKTYTESNTITDPVAQTPPTSPTSSSSSSTVPQTKPTGGRIYRDNGHFLHNDIYISTKEVERILKRDNAVAYAQWKKADGMVIGGGVCIGIGCGLAIAGIYPLATKNYVAALGIDCAALVPLGIGLGLTLSASSHYNKAIDLYNSKFDQAAVQLRWTVAANGLGVAFAF